LQSDAQRLVIDVYVQQPLRMYQNGRLRWGIYPVPKPGQPCSISLKITIHKCGQQRPTVCPDWGIRITPDRAIILAEARGCYSLSRVVGYGWVVLSK